jgi:hypothetical protein
MSTNRSFWSRVRDAVTGRAPETSDATSTDATPHERPDHDDEPIRALLPIYWHDQVNELLLELGVGPSSVIGNQARQLVVTWLYAARDAGVQSPNDASVPALLPRDWPRQVAQLAPYAALEPARRLVDSWVLAASEVTDRP